MQREYRTHEWSSIGVLEEINSLNVKQIIFKMLKLEKETMAIVVTHT